MHKLKLISFELCPYVQRSTITLLFKNIHHEVEYIDLQNKPQWFLKLSPTGKVPVLCIDDDVLFESSVINEYIDDITGSNLLPQDAFKRAKARSWIEYNGDLTGLCFQIMMAKSEKEVQEKTHQLKSKLSWLEMAANSRETFLEDGFSLVDSSLIPLLQRIQFLDNFYSTDILRHYPKLNDIYSYQKEKPYVLKSNPEQFEQKMKSYIDRASVYFSKN